MSTSSNLITLGVLVGVAGLAVAIVKAKAGAAAVAVAAKFRAKQLLTPNELEFLTRLEAAAPELRFFPQVAMGALIDPAVPRSDKKSYYRLRGMFSQKIVDFVAQSRADGSIPAIIELDDRTHDADRDGRRDEMLKSAGYRVVRWNSKAKPDTAAIRAALLVSDLSPAASPTNEAASQVRSRSAGGAPRRTAATLSSRP